MTDLTQFFNFNRPPNGSYTSQQGLGHQQQQQTTTTTFDINEFPSLSKMSLLSQMQASNRTNYVHIAKDSTTNNQSSVDSTQSEFTISSEDFPALPGSNNANVSTIGSKAASSSTTAKSSTSASSASSATSNHVTPNNTINGRGGGNAASAAGLSLQDGTTAAIDQCGKDNNSYFSPIGSSQKPMWMNGGVVDRPTLLSFPGDQCMKKGVNDQVRMSEYSGHGNDFYELTNQGTTTLVGNSSADNGTDLASTSSNSTTFASNKNNNNKKGVQISNDGRVTNIPSSMVTDQFGMIGLLAFLRAAETDPNLASVTFGTDLTALGLNLAAQDKLYPSFAGPWSDQPLKVWEIDYPSPAEYLVGSSLRDKLSTITLKRYHEDTIFFLFYMFPKDMLQIAAAIELFDREWRYHKEEKVWITRAPGISPSEKTQTYERGTYWFFDPHNWRRVPREFYLEYDRLESKQTLTN